MCACVGVEIGSHANTVLLGFYPVMRQYRGARLMAGLSDCGITVDRCIADQVVELWENGVRTYGSCCGHNKAQGFINVAPEDYEKALALGFEPYVFTDDLQRRDTVKTKCVGVDRSIFRVEHNAWIEEGSHE